MEFEARAIEECDYHGIRRLLQQVRYHQMTSVLLDVDVCRSFILVSASGR